MLGYGNWHQESPRQEENSRRLMATMWLDVELTAAAIVRLCSWCNWCYQSDGKRWETKHTGQDFRDVELLAFGGEEEGVLCLVGVFVLNADCNIHQIWQQWHLTKINYRCRHLSELLKERPDGIMVQICRIRMPELMLMQNAFFQKLWRVSEEFKAGEVPKRLKKCVFLQRIVVETLWVGANVQGVGLTHGFEDMSILDTESSEPQSLPAHLKILIRAAQISHQNVEVSPHDYVMVILVNSLSCSQKQASRLGTVEAQQQPEWI